MPLKDGSRERFTYEKDWDEIQSMLDDCERRQHLHHVALVSEHRLSRKEKMHHMKQYKGLEERLLH